MSNEDKAEWLSPFLVKKNGQAAHYCPACDELHFFAIDEPYPNGARWEFNNNAASPSFSPSMLIRSGHYAGGENKPGDCAMCDADGEYGTCGICHYFLKNGRIDYLSDSTHKLAGIMVPMVEIPEKYKSWL